MDTQTTDQSLPYVLCLPLDNEHQKPSLTQLAIVQASPLPSQARKENAEIDRAASRNPNPDIADNELASQTSFPILSAQTKSGHSNVSSTIIPTQQTTPITPQASKLTSSAEKLQCPPPLRLSESLGFEGCGGIIGGFVAILGVFGFLISLWFGYGSAPEAAKALWVWRQLAIRNWMPQAITLASIILQIIVGIQATICTSMVAALLLERLAIPRSQVAQASVMRGINDGPWRLVMLVLSYRHKTLHLLWHPESRLIISVAFLSLALQFTSTILLADMHSFQMVGDLNTTTFNSLFSYPGKDKFQLFQGSLMVNAPVYPVFGEVLTTHDSSPDNSGLSDTGLTQRGLLPMANRDIRTSVREYDGMGVVMSSRVACMQPVITNASLEFSYGSANFRQLQGVLHYNQSLQEARPGTGSLCSASEQCEQVPFDCTIPAAYEEEWAPGSCIVNGVGGSFRGPYQPMWDPASGPWSENSSVWLVYSTNMTGEQWDSIPSGFSMPSAQPSDDSEWTTHEVAPGYFMKLSVCFSAFDFAYRGIRMKAAGATTEHSTTWSLVLSENFNMDQVQAYLGLNGSRQSTADRGILTLDVMPGDGTGDGAPYVPPPPHYDLLDQPADQIKPDALTTSSLQLEMSYELSNGNTKNTTFALCDRCTINAVAVHLDYAFLFSSVLRATGRAADALHAFISVAGFNVYGFLTNSMDVAEQVRVVTTRHVTVPGSWPPSTPACAGLIAVACLLATYLSLVAGTTVLYIRHTRYSRYGNVWHVISQLVASEELEEILELGNNAGDRAVVKGLRTKESIKKDVLVKLGKTDGCENIKVSKSGM